LSGETAFSVLPRLPSIVAGRHSRRNSARDDQGLLHSKVRNLPTIANGLNGHPAYSLPYEQSSSLRQDLRDSFTPSLTSFFREADPPTGQESSTDTNDEKSKEAQRPNGLLRAHTDRTMLSLKASSEALPSREDLSRLPPPPVTPKTIWGNAFQKPPNSSNRNSQVGSNRNSQIGSIRNPQIGSIRNTPTGAKRHSRNLSVSSIAQRDSGATPMGPPPPVPSGENPLKEIIRRRSLYKDEATITPAISNSSLETSATSVLDAGKSPAARKNISEDSAYGPGIKLPFQYKQMSPESQLSLSQSDYEGDDNDYDSSPSLGLTTLSSRSAGKHHSWHPQQASSEGGSKLTEELRSKRSSQRITQGGSISTLGGGSSRNENASVSPERSDRTSIRMGSDFGIQDNAQGYTELPGQQYDSSISSENQRGVLLAELDRRRFSLDGPIYRTNSEQVPRSKRILVKADGHTATELSPVVSVGGASPEGAKIDASFSNNPPSQGLNLSDLANLANRKMSIPPTWPLPAPPVPARSKYRKSMIEPKRTSSISTKAPKVNRRTISETPEYRDFQQQLQEQLRQSSSASSIDYTIRRNSSISAEKKNPPQPEVLTLTATDQSPFVLSRPQSFIGHHKSSNSVSAVPSSLSTLSQSDRERQEQLSIVRRPSERLPQSRRAQHQSTLLKAKNANTNRSVVPIYSAEAAFKSLTAVSLPVFSSTVVASAQRNPAPTVNTPVPSAPVFEKPSAPATMPTVLENSGQARRVSITQINREARKEKRRADLLNAHRKSMIEPERTYPGDRRRASEGMAPLNGEFAVGLGLLGMGGA
jgi:hypothetical protein